LAIILTPLPSLPPTPAIPAEEWSGTIPEGWSGTIPPEPQEEAQQPSQQVQQPDEQGVVTPWTPQLIPWTPENPTPSWTPSEELQAETEALKQALLQSLTKLEQRLEQEKLNYELLKSSQSSQLASLQQRLQTARKEYETAYALYSKFSIRAPFAWTITNIFVTPGETVNVGNQLFTLLPRDQLPTLEVQLTFEEYLTVLDTTHVQLLPLNVSWTITSRSPVTNEEGKYTITIESPSLSLTWDTLVEVIFPLTTAFIYLPQELLEIKNQNEGSVYLLVEGKVQNHSVPLWKRRNDWVEVQATFDTTTQLITNWQTGMLLTPL
jgi:multidrug efflux pump subunit AcrA (membrane-fusion protein)